MRYADDNSPEIAALVAAIGSAEVERKSRNERRHMPAIETGRVHERVRAAERGRIRSPERNPTSGIFPLSVGSHYEGEGTRHGQLLGPSGKGKTVLRVSSKFKF